MEINSFEDLLNNSTIEIWNYILNLKEENKQLKIKLNENNLNDENNFNSSKQEILLINKETIEEMNKKLSLQTEKIDQLLNIRDIVSAKIDVATSTIVDSIEIQLDSNTKSFEQQLEMKMSEVVEQINLNTNNSLSAHTDEELQLFMSQTRNSLEAIRNFQNIPTFSGHEHPLLFMLFKEQSKDSTSAKLKK